jgi:S1-C subfamily serine protease
MPGSPAALAGLQKGDLITKIGDTPVTSPADVSKALTKKELSEGVRIYVANKEGERLLFLKTNR